jgi:UDPglucose 6-dehydrogenase
MKFGLIGSGFVGGCVRRHLNIKNVLTLDEGSIESVNEADTVFMCLPTPYKKGVGFDLSALTSNLEKLRDGMNVVIKSTVLPGTCDAFAVKYPHLHFFFNPEFLKAATPWDDYINPDRQIIGVTADSDCDMQIADQLLDVLPEAAVSEICFASEAEMTKIVANNFLAMKVVLFNEVYDYCKQIGADYEKVAWLVALDSRIGSSHMDVLHEGYRGYSGTCFPKDVQAFVHGSGSELMKKVHEINEILIAGKKS